MWVYYKALESCINYVEKMFTASTVTCDFEQALIETAKAFFIPKSSSNQPKCSIVLCLFRLKQSLHRKLTKLSLHRNKISSFLGEGGLFDILTVIPPSEIKSFGIPFVRSQIMGNEEIWRKFWDYFEDNYLGKRYSPYDWNLHPVLQRQDNEGQTILRNRTNNALERSIVL